MLPEIFGNEPQTTKTVRFSGFEEIAFSTQTTLSVTVEPVPGETNTDNNTREYPIIFTLS